MIDSKGHPSLRLGSWQAPEKLRAFEKPGHEAFADFIHKCSPDPATRTVATTALVLSFWQLKGRTLTETEVPSMLLVNAGESASDSIDDFVRDLVYDEEKNRPQVQREGPCMGMPIDRAPRMMKNAFLERRALGGDVPLDGSEKYYAAKNAELKFDVAKATAYGRSGCRNYTQAWHPEYGLLTDEDDPLILRLNGEADRSAFRNDLLNDPGKLTSPTGIGRHLCMEPKRVSISGSVRPGEWKGRAVSRSIDLGAPLFALPHNTGQLEAGREAMFGSLAIIWRSARCLPVFASSRLPNSDWVSAYEAALRRRLQTLPGDYEFAVLQTVRQLDGVCDRIANFAGEGKVGLMERVALCRDLYQHTLRGMVLGVVALSWHGPGLYLGPEAESLRDEAFKLLRFLRNHGPASKSAILQRCHLKKRQRDLLLERFSAEDLVQVDGTTVSATTYSEFVRALYERKEFPPVTNHSEVLLESRKGAS